MYKIVFFALIASFSLNAQQYFENFEGGGIPPNWSVTNNSSRVVNSSGTSASGALIPNGGTTSGAGNLTLRNCSSATGAVSINVDNVDMTGQTGIKVGMLRRRTTGTNEWTVPTLFEYSIDGSSYTSLTGNLESGAVQSAYSWAEYNLGADANNQANLRFRISYTPNETGACAGAPNLRIDDFIVYYGTEPFPIELSFFSARNLGKSNSLNWKTTAETNFSHFEIQRSSNAKNFESIGLTNGVGSSENGSEYFFEDEKPMVGDNYYRLKGVSFSGPADYSKIVHVYYDGEGDPVIYPNPTSNSVSLGNIQADEIQNIRVLTSVGSMAKDVKLEGNSIDLSALNGTNFIVEITEKSGKVTRQKVVKH